MIEFATTPDPIFLAIFTEGLSYIRHVQLVQFEDGVEPSTEQAQDLDEFYANLFPELLPYFSRRQVIEVIDRLLAASSAPKLYRLTDYHWLVVYRCLDMFCALHNDGEPVAEVDGKVGPYIIDTIDFGEIVERFFFDTDYLFGTDFIVAREHRLEPVPGVSAQAAKIAAGLRPDPTDLELEKIDVAESQMEADDDMGRVPREGYVGPYPLLNRDDEQS